MSHECVMQVDANGVETGKARMVLSEQGWHGLAHVMNPISLADVHNILGTDELVTVDDIYYPDGQKSEFAKGLRWKNGPNLVELGIVGPETGILQNKDFIDSCAPWLDNNLAEIAGAGLLSSGKIIYIQFNAKDLQPAVIRKLTNGENDLVVARILFMNGHGDMSMRAGYTAERVVCMNTLRAALGTFKGETSTKKSHRAKGSTAEQSEKVRIGMDKIHAMMQGIIKEFNDEVNGLKFLESVEVKPTDLKIEKTIHQYAQLCDGKNPNSVLKTDFTPSAKDIQFVDYFKNSPGNMGRTWYDLYNAATFYLTHGKMNEMKGDRPGDDKARRFQDLLVGPRNKLLNTAYDGAMKMANAQA